MRREGRPKARFCNEYNGNAVIPPRAMKNRGQGGMSSFWRKESLERWAEEADWLI